MKAVAPILREAGLSVEQAQEVAHGYAAMIQTHQAEQERLAKEHAATLKAESEAAFTPEQIADAHRAFEKIATPGMRELWNHPMLGNNKDFLGVFVKMAALMKDDVLPGGRPGEAEKKRDADVFYPSMNK